MARQQNPRRLALKILRDMSRWCREMIATWDQEQGKFDPEAGWRKLLPSEKREKDPKAWERLEQRMRAVSEQASQLADYARFNAERALKEQQEADSSQQAS